MEERMGRVRAALAEAVPPGEVIELTRKLVGIPSHPQHPGKERQVAEFLAEFLSRNGLRVQFQDVAPGRPNVVATWPGQGGGRSLMFNGHMDTVPPYAMEIDPFAATVEGDRLYGLGAADTKGGLAAMALALVGLARAGIRLAGDLVLTAVVDEEYRGEGTEAVIYSGLRADGAIVAEPTGLKVCSGHKGLEWLEITVHGRTVHSGSKELGVNAISRAARLIVALEDRLVPKLPGRAHPFLGAPSINFGFIQGGSQPSTVAGSCTIKLDRRTTPAESPEVVWSDFREVFEHLSREDPDFRAEIRRMPEGHATMDHQAFVTPPDHPLVRCTAWAVGVVTGTAAEPVPFPAWTDAGFLAVQGGIPALVLGPGEVSQAHSPTEWVSVRQLEQAVVVYALSAASFCGLAGAGCR